MSVTTHLLRCHQIAFFPQHFERLRGGTSAGGSARKALQLTKSVLPAFLSSLMASSGEACCQIV